MAPTEGVRVPLWGRGPLRILLVLVLVEYSQSVGLVLRRAMGVFGGVISRGLGSKSSI